MDKWYYIGLISLTLTVTGCTNKGGERSVLLNQAQTTSSLCQDDTSLQKAEIGSDVNKRIQQITASIGQKVNGKWVRPRGTYKNLSCVVQICLTSVGTVGEAKIVKSSNNQTFDNSALAAVYKASPLPVPQDMLSYFRQFNFKFSQ
jgi:colicin import membrane protein